MSSIVPYFIRAKSLLLQRIVIIQPFVFQCYRIKTPKQKLLEKHQKVKVKKMPRKPAESKRGNLLTPTTAGGNNHPWSRRYAEGGGGRIPVVSSRREALTGKHL